ncbi:MAG: hypothetical protein B5766_00685 [Candidatus Lumbricidophila eiseniae]|uniref:ABC3 transporter permease C-terminal domain-containing protein n=1 Tax=Candidatus Lumbricidiphila eiseniae TaxID=1969409 RepID=A0A2A6FUX5_9MICO|nr:MAG: hypothetical protein B5766_00685 [Candidatus Lumbricidophila eiseniae]
MRLLLKANFRVLRGSLVTGVILVLFAVVSGFVSSYLYYGNVPMMRAYEASLASSNVEQFRFLPALELTDSEISEIVATSGITTSADQPPTVQGFASDDRINLVPYYDVRASELSEQYDFAYESVRVKVVDTDGVHYYVSTKPASINRVVTADGAREVKDGEVLMTAQHARLSDLKIGDSVLIGSTAYRIAGTYFQPSNSLLGASGSGALGNTANAGILMSESDFESVESPADLIFVGVSHDGTPTSILAGMRSNDRVSYVSSSDHLASISALRDNFSTSLTLMLIGTALFACAVVLVVWQIIRNNLRRSVAVVGVMKAIGLHPLSIGASFAVYVVPVLIGVCLGSLVGYLLAPSFGAGYLRIFEFYLPALVPDVPFTVLQVLLALVVPLLVCIATAMRLVRSETLALLNGGFISSSTLRLRWLYSAMRRFSMTTRVRWSFALSNAPRVFVVVASAAVSVLVLAFSLAILAMGARPLDQLRASMNFDDLVQYTTPQNSGQSSANKGYADSFYISGAGSSNVDRSFDALFVDPSFSAILAPGSDGRQIFELLGSGEIVVSSKFASDYGVVVGDRVSIQPQSLPAVSLVVAGINPIAMDTRMYLPTSDLPDLVPAAERNAFNTWFSTGGLAPASESDAVVVSKQILVDQAQNAISASFTLVPVLIFIAVVLSLGVLFLIAYLNVFDNRRMIALLDQLGYQASDSVRLVINVYGFVILVGAVGGALVSPLLLAAFGGIVAQASDYHLVLETGWPSLAVVALAVVAFAQLSHFLVLPWVRKISPTALAYS